MSESIPTSSNALRFVAIIPARYASTRFPGKPLVKIGQKTMIQRVYEQVSKVLNDVYVATDDQRVFEHVQSFGGNVITEDIKEGCSIIEKQAELLKTRFGSAWPGENIWN